MNQVVLTPQSPSPDLKRLVPRRSDQEFLPAAIEIIETPASPAAVLFLVIICLFVVGAVVWASIGRIDIFAVAAGKVQPTGQSKTVEALDPGRVRAILVGEGSRVKAGDVLLRLDPTEATAEVDSIKAELASRRAEVLRNHVALDAAAPGKADVTADPVIWPSDIPASIRDREARVLDTDLASLQAALASLEASAGQKVAERDRLTATIAAESLLIRTLQDRVDMRQSLVASNSGTRSNLIDAMQQLQSERATLAANQGWLGEANAGIKALRADANKTRQAFLNDHAQKLADAGGKVDELTQRLIKAKAAEDHRILPSPIDGTVQSLAITTLGQVVSAGQQVMRIVPDNVPLEVIAYVENRDIGFLHEGQTAVIKVDAFPFTRYGTLNGTVVRIARDAVPTPDAARMQSSDNKSPEAGRSASGDQISNLVYPVILRLDQSSIGADGQQVGLEAGMAISAEIQTGSRRLIDYVFAPLTELRSRAMHER